MTGKLLRYSADPPPAGTAGILWPDEKYSGVVRFPEYGEATKRFQIHGEFQDIGPRGNVMQILRRAGYFSRSHPLGDRVLPLIVPKTQPRGVHFQSSEVVLSQDSTNRLATGHRFE
jgi:hypothetical protein